MRRWIGPGASASVIARCCGYCSRRGSEGEEERVALRVDLDPAFGRARLAHDGAVLGESVGVRVRAELVQELRRALDVGEEEGDGAGREVGSHARVIIRLSRARVQAPGLGKETPSWASVRSVP